ncbi:YlzJ-like family protein [Ruminiclostridium josui]|uniref:YlzJ-like family protein n=1 Tax=Ruminiclostridium josui TaxID=1499 RepID=UPI0004632778|nr:YlzJ-like family protein [Ruminiclostridium josui]
MILYTIYDHNVVMGSSSKDNGKNNLNYSEMNIDGIQVQVSRYGDSDYQVQRIISTNPYDYLNPKIQPGTIIPK